MYYTRSRVIFLTKVENTEAIKEKIDILAIHNKNISSFQGQLWMVVEV